MARAASPIRDDHNESLDSAWLETRSLRLFVMVIRHSVCTLAYLHMLVCACVCVANTLVHEHTCTHDSTNSHTWVEIC